MGMCRVGSAGGGLLVAAAAKAGGCALRRRGSAMCPVANAFRCGILVVMSLSFIPYY